MSRRYPESPQTSAEYLRLALPHIADHGIAVNPFNYAVWYDYVSETSPELRREIDERTAAGAKLNEQDCRELYKKYVVGAEESGLVRLQGQMREVLQHVRQSVQEADQTAGDFDHSLEEYGARLEEGLEEGLGTPVLGAVVREIASETRRMQEANAQLRSRLDETAQEVGNLRDQLEEARQEAVTDPLTSLINRKGFGRAVEKTLADMEEHDHAPSLLMIDIDHFKRFNDTHGHLLGDQILRLVAAVLQNSVKGKDVPARFGGEEFAVLLPDTPLSGACALADKLRAEIEKRKIRRVDTGEIIGSITVSVGVSAHRLGEPFDDCVQRADAALYLSKRNGRNRVSCETHLNPDDLRGAESADGAGPVTQEAPQAELSTAQASPPIDA